MKKEKRDFKLNHSYKTRWRMKFMLI